MIKRKWDYLKKRNKELYTYYRNDRKNIDGANMAILQMASVATTVLIAIFMLVASLIVNHWSATIHYYAFLLVMFLFAVFAHLATHNEKQKKADDMSRLMCDCFMFLVMTFLILLDTVPDPHSAQSFVGIFLVVAPILFITPFWDMLAFQLYLVIGYTFMAIIFKDPGIARSDIFTVLFGFIVSQIVYVVVMDLRISDYFQKNSYKLSSELDALTGISNRATCQKQIEHYLLNPNPDSACAMFVLDVDNFKQVNDKLGHSMGDKVLQGVAAILEEVLRSSDVVGRFGGDEFIVFLRDLYDEKLIERKCQEIEDRMKKMLDGKFDITCSIGVCVLTSGKATMEEMFSVADDALYEAKAFGKGTYVLHEYEQNNLTQAEKPLMVIVDDNLVDRETIGIQFEGKFRIKKFENSDVAMKFINTNAKEISIILLDMIMPGISGFDVLRRIKSRPDTAWIPVIAISSDIETEEQALSCGAEDMIAKPIVPAVTKLRVENVMKKMKHKAYGKVKI